jgi:hypothetical protein
MTVISLANVCYSQNNWTTKKDKIKIPFELTHNLIILDVDFNGTPLKMILDTGASNNMIFSVSENDSIIMNDANKITISGAGNTEDIEGYLSRKNRLKIRDYIANDFEVVFATNQDISIVNKLGITINGILGSSFFKDNLIEIDYQSRKIIIYKDKQAKLKKIANKYTKLQVEINKNRPYVSLEAKIEDSNHKLKLLFDTGLGDGLWLFENDSIKCNSNFFIDILGRGLSGDVEGKKSRVKEVTFPNSSLKKVLVSYPDKKFFDQFKILKNRNGSLGGDIIKRFNWFFDYENQTFYYKKNTFFDLPFEYNMSGIEVQHAGSQWVKDEVSDNSSGIPIKVNEFNFENPNANTKFNYKYELKPIFEIYAVRVNSSAAKAGLKVGDIILKINNKSSNRLNIQSITNLFQSEDGKLINITIERNGKKLDFEFSLEKIL